VLIDNKFNPARDLKENTGGLDLGWGLFTGTFRSAGELHELIYSLRKGSMIADVDIDQHGHSCSVGRASSASRPPSNSAAASLRKRSTIPALCCLNSRGAPDARWLRFRMTAGRFSPLGPVGMLLLRFSSMTIQHPLKASQKIVSKNPVIDSFPQKDKKLIFRQV
jgi:hypothetical protein